MADVNKDPFEVGSSEFTLIDPDTIKNRESGKRGRLQGVEMPETRHVISEDGEVTDYKPGTAGGETAHAEVADLIRKYNYTKVVDKGEEAAFDRSTIDLENPEGRSLVTDMYSHGLASPNQYTTSQQSDYATLGWARGYNIFEGSDDFNRARIKIDNAKMKMGWDPTTAKPTAATEKQYALGDGDFGSVAFRRPDRKIDNTTDRVLSTSWDIGINSAQQGLYGFANMLGKKLGIESLEEWGDVGVEAQDLQISDLPYYVSSYKDVEGFGDAIDYVIGLGGASLPFMLNTMGAMALAPFTYGTSLSIPVMTYAGGVWAEQDDENKDATKAITGGVLMAALDMIGVKGVQGLKGTSKEMFESAVKGVMDKKGVAREVAEAELADATKRQMAEFAKAGGAVLNDQLNSKHFILSTLGRATTGTTAEAITEGTQEMIGYLAAKPEEEWNWSEAKERFIEAAIAGGVLGGTISTAIGVKDVGGWVDAKWAAKDLNPAEKTYVDNIADQEAEAYGYVRDVDDLTTDIDNEFESIDVVEAAEANKERKKKQGFVDKAVRAVTRAPARFLKSASSDAVWADLQKKYKSAFELAHLIGGQFSSLYGGANFEQFKRLKSAEFRNVIADDEVVYNVFNEGREVSRADRVAISERLYKIFNDKGVINKHGNLIPDNLPKDLTPEQKLAVINLHKNMVKLAKKMHKEQLKYNPSLGKLKNYLATTKVFDRAAIEKNRKEFERLLVEKKKLTPGEAAEVTDAIISNPNIESMMDAEAAIDGDFDVFKGTAAPGTHKKRTLSLASDLDFKDFMQQDLFANMEASIRTASRYIGYQKYLGKNGEKIGKYLARMKKEGASDEEIGEVAERIRNYFNAESGNYHRFTTPEGKKFQAFQRNIMTWMMFTGLPLSTLSSLPEMALIFSGMENVGIREIKKAASQMANTMGRGLNEIFRWSQKEIFALEPTEYDRQMKAAGYKEFDVGAATRSGVEEHSIRHKDWIEMFFKWNGLQGYTDMTRSIRMSFFGDYFYDTLIKALPGLGPNGVPTNGTQEAVMRLRELGVSDKDVLRMAELFSKVKDGTINQGQEKELARLVTVPTMNFVDEAVVLPQAFNRPLLYQDPRFALFTQFNGFISAFTSKVIPRLWNDLVKKGKSPAMGYNTFSVMMTMILFGFLSQDMKDQIKYGETSPYLDDMEYIRRGISSSGLMGTPERILNTAFPMFERRSDNPADFILNEIADQAPAISQLGRVGTVAGKVLEGDLEGTVTQGLALTPAATFTAARQEAGRQAGAFGDWLFD